MKNSIWAVLLILTALSSGACARSVKAYHGADVLDADLSFFNGFATTCEKLRIRNFDSEFGGDRLSAPAGEHRMEIVYRAIRTAPHPNIHRKKPA